MIFSAIVVVVSIIAGAVASVAGFGIGSLLTPLLAFQYGTKLAVAAVSIPHVIGTVFRFWLIRKHIDKRVLLNFGLFSAAGGLAGALLHKVLTSPILSIVLGIILIFVGVSGLTGIADRMKFDRRISWIAGAASGLLGGLVGNQGGIRSASLLGFDLSRDTFVATATAIALLVDAARVPVYLATQSPDMARIWAIIALASAGTVFGTFAGRRILERIPEQIFHRVVSAIVLALGIALLLQIRR